MAKNVAFTKVKKRDGSLVDFDAEKIVQAIWKAMQVVSEGDEDKAKIVAEAAVENLIKKHKASGPPGIEEIQDVVQAALLLSDFPKTATAYIRYRLKREEIREQQRVVPERVKKLVEESRQYFRGPMSEFVFYRSYSRWIEAEGRRETWIEAVERYMHFMKDNLGKKLSEKEYEEVHDAILKLSVMPSMRLMWSAGKAAASTNVCAYNCAFIAPKELQDFAEIMYLSMCGTGVGFSIEEQNVGMLPMIKRQTGHKRKTHVVHDSKEGWGDALLKGLETWYAGEDIDFDYSKLRPAGARLRIMGGRSSGPKPLVELMKFARKKILKRQGRRLSTIDVHDIICKIGEIVEMGGVRRSALISLSDLDDLSMRFAKSGNFQENDGQRHMANISVAYMEKPSTIELLDEWISLAKSGSGERGIFNRASLLTQAPERRREILSRDVMFCGTNPCGEIVLKSKQFCNLTEVVARAEDSEETLLRKIRIATIIGTYQATLTNFPYLSKEWRKNCEEERLLGVSITGQWDCPAVRNAETLRKLRDRAIRVNKTYADKFGINESTAITCVKPSGTVSQLVDSASGLHTRHARYYIRRIRIGATDSMFKMLKDQKVPHVPEVNSTEENATNFVLSFPVKGPADSKFRNDMSAIEQLEYWKMLKENYTEHNPSATISVGKHEWIEVVAWVYKHWDSVGGLTFIAREEGDNVYELPPYEEIDKEQYEKLVAEMPEIDFSRILIYEKEDETKGARELACVSGVCDLTM